MNKYVLTSLLSLAAGIVVATWAYDIRVASLNAVHAKELESIAEARTKGLQEQAAKYQEQLDRVNQLDSTKTKELNDAKADNARLRDLYSGADAERKRLRIAVNALRTDTGEAGTGSTCVADATTVELSDAAGSAVWDLRGSLIEDREKILGLQAYVCILKPELQECVHKPP